MVNKENDPDVDDFKPPTKRLKSAKSIQVFSRGDARTCSENDPNVGNFRPPVKRPNLMKSTKGFPAQIPGRILSS